MPEERSSLAVAMEHAKWALVPFSMVMSVRYFYWRATETLNLAGPAASTVSVTLLAAEMVAYLTFVLFYWQTFAPSQPEPVETVEKDLPTVDVFITIYNEPVDILFRTLAGATALDYPVGKLHIYVLDDGRRPAVAEMVERFGCRYLARDENTHAKAGNVNYGLENSGGSLVFILDCDHVPVSSFLRETVGFFQDPKVAFVQTPHHFYNPDCYRKNLYLEDELANEQDLFFRVIQPGRNPSSSAIFAGSAAVLRRSALEEIGGCQTLCAIEDLHTGMVLHAKGYRSIFYERTMSGALSPENFMGYLVQRARWTRGGVQLFLLRNPLFQTGLSITQRAHYFASLLYFFHGWIRLVFLMTPLAFLLFKTPPIIADTWTLVLYFLPHYILSHHLFHKICKQYRNPFWSDVYETGGSFWLAWTALITFFQPETLIFNVTPKGEASLKKEVFHWRYVLPHIILLGLLLLGVGLVTHHLVYSDLTLDAYALNIGWALFNIVLLATSIEVAREQPHKRATHRLHRSIPCELSFEDTVIAGKTVDISDHGVGVLLDTQAHIDQHVTLKLFGAGGMETSVEAEVLRTEWLEDGTSRVGLKFLNMSHETSCGVIRHMFSPPDSWAAVTHPRMAGLRSFSHIAGVTLRKRLKKPRPAKLHGPRSKKTVACELMTPLGPLPALIEDLGSTGAVICVESKVAPHKRVTLELALAAGGWKEVTAEVMHRIKSTDHKTRYEVHFIDPPHVDHHAFKEEEALVS
ncbi:MAG: glycosyltransferase family 2 protein [Elusimicrobiota bacterium]